MNEILTADEIKLGLKTQFLGRRIYAYNQTRSTQDVALRLGASGAEEGTLVLAEYQTAGRGKMNRKWFSPPRSSILMSIILRPTIKLSDAPIVTFLAAVGATQAIIELTDLKVSIKWPNDIYINDKKVGGILTQLETNSDHVRFIVLGIAINVNLDIADQPQAIRQRATSLSIELGYGVSRLELLRLLLLKLEKLYLTFKKGDLKSIIYKWKYLSNTLGRRIIVETVSSKFEGFAVDVDEDGSLLVRTDIGKLEKIIAGSVTLLN